MINIVTSICVDTSPEKDTVKYPQVGNGNAQARRSLYWKLVFTFCCSSLRCNPEDKHLIYTNDERPVIFKGINLQEKLHKKGVEIIVLPFESFLPPQGF